MPDALPSVTVVIPVLDEAATIDACLQSVADQDYKGEWGVVIADGGSTDGTLDRLDRWETSDGWWRVIHNPLRRQSPGMNLAVVAAVGEVIVRMDAHSTYDRDYVTRSVGALLETDAVAVGGPIRPRAAGGFARAVAAAMRIPLMTGTGRFHREDHRGFVDTVYLGAFRRGDFLEIGGLRSFPSGAGEDADLYWRWRRAGRTVWMDPTIRSEYRPRRSPRALFRQYFRYGQAKAEMLWANGVWPSSRPLAPALLVAGLLAVGVYWAAVGAYWPMAVLLGVWVVALLASAALAGWPGPRLLVELAGGVMHLSYGLGLWWGVVRGPWPVRSRLRAVQPPW
ncbi:MAG: glycosyltransferase family 2 protein [Acidimicrobiia bacterium]